MFKDKRIVSVECLRIVMMFGIVLLHIVTQDGYFGSSGIFTRHFINCLSPSVVGFVFISGYFGINFKVKKIVNLLAMAVFYAIALGVACGWDRVIARLTNDWFLYGYVVLMFCAPIMNVAVETLGWRILGLPFCVFIWSYLCVIPGIKQYIPHPYGFAPLSFFTMMGIYCVARLYSVKGLEAKIQNHPGVSLCGWVISLALVFIGFYHHNSLAALSVVGITFAFVRKINVPTCISRVVKFVSPSVFAIYLIHSSPLGHVVRRSLLKILSHEFTIMIAWLISALVIFMGAVVIDILRRYVVTAYCKIWCRFKIIGE